MPNPGFKVILYICFLMTILTVACGNANTFPTQETSGLPPTKQAASGLTPVPLPSSPSSTATLTASPIPMFVFDLSGYDPDIYQPIYVEHQPQLIVRLDEMVVLKFFIVNNRIYCNEVPCQVVPLLYYTYENENTFQSAPLVSENIDGMDYLVVRLPATDQAGKALRYYVDFSFPEAGYTQRYPTAGTIDLFATTNFISIELPVENPVEPGDKVYTFYWGHGPNTVHTEVQGHIRLGPPAIDVASDGRIALLNPVDNRVLIYDPKEKTYSSFQLPFTVYPDDGDLAFDQNDRLVVCDFNGKEVKEIPRGIPYCYRLRPDGGIDVSVPVYVNFPIKLVDELKVLDRYDYKLVAPFNSTDAANSRGAQRQKQIWKLPYDGLDWYTIRFADIEAGITFEVHSDSHIGAEGFEKTPHGYLMIFSSVDEQIRAVWIDSAGLVMKDVTLPNAHYSVLSVSDMVVAQDGSLYVMSSTKNGVEIHFEEAP